MRVEIEVNDKTLRSACDMMVAMSRAEIVTLEPDALRMQKIKNIIGMMHYETLSAEGKTLPTDLDSTFKHFRD